MIPLVRGWVVVCTLVVATGWVLSGLHALNVRGYAVAIAVSGLFLAMRMRSRPRVPWNSQRIRAICRRRFVRPLPMLFLSLALLAVLGGVLHPPNNYDAMTYRVPRMLSWLSEQQWHWIHTLNLRQNNRAPGYEWLSMPMLAFTGTDRLLFFINAISFALLPGLIFSVFTRLGIRQRVAWSWMWLLPSGYSLALQAGGISNDMVAVPFALAAVDFALRARRSQSVAEAWLSVLAVALLTAIKGSNLPLLLPWIVALAPSWRLFFRAPARSVAVIALAAMVSFLPTALLNHLHCGDWSGAVLEVPPGAMPSPVLGLTVNSLQLVAQNLAPPLFPLTGWWNAHVMEWLPTGLRAAIMQSNFRSGVFNLGELPVEDTAGLGFGLMVLLLVSLGWLLTRRHCGSGEHTTICRPATVFPWRFMVLLTLSVWVSLGVYMAKVATTCAGRIITPYYPLLLVGLLGMPGWNALVRRCWWRRLAAAVVWLAIGVVVVNPARPLWPAQTLLATARNLQPGNRVVERAARVYATYARRNDALAPIREALPATARRIGLAGSLDHPEASLWRPFGSRITVHVLPGDTAEQLRAAGVEYIVLTPEATELFQMPLDQWLREYHAEIVRDIRFAYLASQGPQTWHLVHLLPAFQMAQSHHPVSPRSEFY